MKIVAVSDLHGQLPKIPECDLLLIAGDVCPIWNHEEFYQQMWLDTNFRTWLGNVDADQIIGIAGNHDWIFQVAPHEVPELPWIYLEDESTTYKGLKIYGTPWQRKFYDWAFNLDEEQLVEKYAAIPDDVDIIVSHGPPLNFGDLNQQGENLGSPGLFKRIEEIKPKLVVYGHIHSGYGKWENDGVLLGNASVVNEKYVMSNEPLVYEIEDEKNT